MRVYFCGSHAVGKSSLARHVSLAYKIPLITEAARMVLSEQELQVDTLRADLQVADQYQQQVFDRQLLEEQKYTTSFVSDRSLLDCLAYSAQHTGLLSQLLLRSELANYLDTLNLKDTILFFVRPSRATLRADGVRETLNWDAIVAIDAMIKYQLQMWDIRHFQINTDNMQERIQLVDNILTGIKIC
jgi:hypothetical protein